MGFSLASVLICGCCGVSLGRAHHFLHSATDTMKGHLRQPTDLRRVKWSVTDSLIPLPRAQYPLFLFISPSLILLRWMLRSPQWHAADGNLQQSVVGYFPLWRAMWLHARQWHKHHRCVKTSAFGSRYLARSYSNCQNDVCILQSIKAALD